MNLEKMIYNQHQKQLIMENFEQKQRYQRAKKRVDDERGFYSHLAVYIIINIIIYYINVNAHFGNSDVKNWFEWHLFLTPVLWGIGLLLHGINVFTGGFKFFREWEKRKIEELMNDEDF